MLCGVSFSGKTAVSINTPEFLAEKAASGDESSFVEFCGILQKKLFRTAKGILGNETLALEAVSEAVFRAYKGIKQLRNPKYAETWFIRIVINAANDIHRKRKREVLMETVPEVPVSDNHEELEFQHMINSLQPELREIISLKYYSGYKLEEIAEILKLPEGTVKSRLHRALGQLRVEYEEV